MAIPVTNTREHLFTQGIETNSVIYDILTDFPSTPVSGQVVNKSGLLYKFNGLGWDELVGYKIAGTITQPTITEESAGIISISSFTASLFDNASNSGNAQVYTLDALENQVISFNTYYYIVANYNSGNPIIQIITDNNLITHSDIINVAQVNWINEGTVNTLKKFYTGNYGIGLPNKLGHRLIHTERFGYESGLSTSIDISLHILMNSGRIWYDGEVLNLDAIDTNSVVYTKYYKTSGSWTPTTANVLDTTKYNDGSNLATLNNNHYCVIWIYRSMATGDNTIYTLFGEGDYSLKDAQDSSEPAKPDILAKLAVLVSRMIFQKSGTVPVQTNFYLTKAPTGANVINHNDTINIQGGTTDKYYHLTEVNEGATVTTPVDADTLLINENSTSIWKKVSWSSLKSTLKTYFDTLYTYVTETLQATIEDTATVEADKYVSSRRFWQGIKKMKSSVFELYDSIGTQCIEIRNTTATLYSTFIGRNAGSSVTTGINNVGIGYEAAKSIQDANYCVAIGEGALRSATSGGTNVAIGDRTLYNLTTGINNSAVGHVALQKTTGSNNVGVGSSAGFNNSSGAGNTALGTEALYSNTTSSNQTAVGYKSLKITTGLGNTGIGTQAGVLLTTGTNNFFAGYLSGTNASQKVDATNSSSIGYNSYTTASNQIVLGDANVTTFGFATPSPAAFAHMVIATATALYLKMSNLNTGATASDGFDIGIDSTGNAYLTQFENLPMIFKTNNAEIMKFFGSLVASSGTEIAVQITPTVNQSGTAAYSALVINVTETATGSGTKKLLDLQVAGVSKAYFQSNGALSCGTILSNFLSASTNNALSLCNSVSYTSSSALQTVVQITPTINQSGTAGYQALYINPTETATGSGVKNLLVLAVGGTTKALVQNSGNLVFQKTSGVGVKVDVDAPLFGWKDLVGNVNERAGASAPTMAAWNGSIYQESLGTTNLKEVFNEYHVPHDWLPLASAVSPNEKAAYIHAHWSVIATPTGVINFLFDVTYAKGYNQAAFNSPITVGVTQTVEGTLLEHQIAEVQFCAPGGVIASAVNISITATSTTLTSASSLFTSADIGKTIRITGAGVAGADLDTYITAYTSATQVTVNTAASTTVTTQPNFKWRVIDSDLIEPDGLIITRTWRDPGRTADTLDVAPFLHYIDIHYQSTQLPTKNKNYPFYT